MSVYGTNCAWVTPIAIGRFGTCPDCYVYLHLGLKEQEGVGFRFAWIFTCEMMGECVLLSPPTCYSGFCENFSSQPKSCNLVSISKCLVLYRRTFFRWLGVVFECLQNSVYCGLYGGWRKMYFFRQNCFQCIYSMFSYGCVKIADPLPVVYWSRDVVEEVELLNLLS